MNLLLDTNLLLIYNRENQTSTRIEKEYGVFSDENNQAISIVSIGEIRSILYKSGVGQRRNKLLKRKLDKLVKIAINHKEVFKNMWRLMHTVNANIRH